MRFAICDLPLEDLEKKLYKTEKEAESEELTSEPRKSVSRKEPDIREGWGENKSDVPDFVSLVERFPLKKIFFWGVVWISVAVVMIIGYFLYQAFTFGGISLDVNIEEPVLAGSPFNVTINYSNNSPSLLTNAKLSLTLPPEFSFVGGDTTRRVQSEDLGTVGIGTIGQQTLQMVVLRGEGTCADIVATIEYNASGVGSRFEKKSLQSVCVTASAATLNIFNANQVFSNQTFDMKISYKNISKESLRSLELRLEYPQNFTFQNATLKPDLGDNIWRLGDLRPGSSNEITVRGSVIAEADSFFEIKAKIFSKAGASEYIVAEKVASVSISPPPLGIAVAVQTSTDHIAKLGEALNYTLQFKNNTDVGFRDVVIKAHLTGEMFDFSTIDKKINFNSITRELTWNKSHLEALGLLPPGGLGIINFQVHVRDSFPITHLSDKDFTLKVDAQIDSPTVPSFVSAERTISIASLETKVAGLITVDSKALFRDAASGIVNSGPMPPRVNMPTNYTVHWIIKNYATDVSNIEVRAFLQSGVRATGIVRSNIETSPVYNDRTQEMVWNIQKIPATRGVASGPIEGVFQIEALPAVNQVKSNMPLIGETKISALDLFTDLNLNYTAGDISTSLNNNDPTVGLRESNVAP